MNKVFLGLIVFGMLNGAVEGASNPAVTSSSGNPVVTSSGSAPVSAGWSFSGMMSGAKSSVGGAWSTAKAEMQGCKSWVESAVGLQALHDARVAIAMGAVAAAERAPAGVVAAEKAEIVQCEAILRAAGMKNAEYAGAINSGVYPANCKLSAPLSGNHVAAAEEKVCKSLIEGLGNILKAADKMSVVMSAANVSNVPPTGNNGVVGGMLPNPALNPSTTGGPVQQQVGAGAGAMPKANPSATGGMLPGSSAPQAPVVVQKVEL